MSKKKSTKMPRTLFLMRGNKYLFQLTGLLITSNYLDFARIFCFKFSIYFNQLSFNYLTLAGGARLLPSIFFLFCF